MFYFVFYFIFFQVIKGVGLNNMTPAKSLKLKKSLRKVVSEYVSYFRLNVTLENYTVEVVYQNITGFNNENKTYINKLEKNNINNSIIKTYNKLNTYIEYIKNTYINYQITKNVDNTTSAQTNMFLNVEYSVRMPIKATELIIERLNFAISDTLFSRRLSLYYGEKLEVSGLFYQEYKITKNPSRASSKDKNEKSKLM